MLHYEGHKKQYEREIISEYDTVLPGIYYAPIAFGYLSEASLYSNNFDKFGNVMNFMQNKKGHSMMLYNVISWRRIFFPGMWQM